MDLTQVQSTTITSTSNNANDRNKTFASEAQITGGRVTFNQTMRDMSGPLIDGLD